LPGDVFAGRPAAAPSAASTCRRPSTPRPGDTWKRGPAPSCFARPRPRKHGRDVRIVRASCFSEKRVSR
jgi:hypothetical protein